MNSPHVLSVLAVAALVSFTMSSIEAAPHLQTPTFSVPTLQAGLKCGLVNGKLVCGDTKSSGKHQDDDDEDDDDDHHKGKKKKTNNDDDTGLENCTIQSSNSGGGCKSGFKYVCEKMKSNKKCCGCVRDKNAISDPGPNPNYSCCDGFGADGKKVGERLCGEITINKQILKDTYNATTITCTAQ